MSASKRLLLKCFLFKLILRMNNKLPLFITLINNEIINKKHCMQIYGHTMLSISLIYTVCLSYAKYFLYGYNLADKNKF
jgi:hypothetical protein